MALSESERHQLNRIENKLDEMCRSVHANNLRIASLEQSRCAGMRVMWIAVTSAATATAGALFSIFR